MTKDTYQTVAAALREHYDRTASRRDRGERAVWKLDVRQRFLLLLQEEGKRDVLEIGAGPGFDSLFFQENGLRVVATDLSPAMVELCQQKGLEAHVRDFLSLDLPDESVDAVYALNCLLHVPRADLPAVLKNLCRMLRKGGLLNAITYGGVEREGTFAEGGFEERFLSYYTRERLVEVYTALFELVEIHEIPTGEAERPVAFSLILRKR